MWLEHVADGPSVLPRVRQQLHGGKLGFLEHSRSFPARCTYDTAGIAVFSPSFGDASIGESNISLLGSYLAAVWYIRPC